jgi:hypothetical protein
MTRGLPRATSVSFSVCGVCRSGRLGEEAKILLRKLSALLHGSNTLQQKRAILGQCGPCALFRSCKSRREDTDSLQWSAAEPLLLTCRDSHCSKLSPKSTRQVFIVQCLLFWSGPTSFSSSRARGEEETSRGLPGATSALFHICGVCRSGHLGKEDKILVMKASAMLAEKLEKPL